MAVWCYSCDDDLQTMVTQLQNEDLEKEEMSNFLDKLHEIISKLLMKKKRGVRTSELDPIK